MSKRETNRYEVAGEYDNLQQQQNMNFADPLDEVDELSLLAKLRAFINSHRFHAVIVILVVVDCLCVALELFIFEVERHMANDPSISDCINKITQWHNVSLQHIEPHHTDQHSGIHLFLKIVEGVLKYTSLGILGLFVVEVIVKLAVEPRIFIKSKWEILDAVVVVLTFMLNVFLLIKKDAFESVAGLFALLR